MSSALEDTVPASSGPQSSSPGDGTAPSRISRFEIEGKLGAGGNGVVWLARDPMLDRKVAIKVLHNNDNADALQRLVREAQAAAKVVHENVIGFTKSGSSRHACVSRWSTSQVHRSAAGKKIAAGATS